MSKKSRKIQTGYADGPELADTKPIVPYVDKSLTLITEKEVSEFFNHGLKQAADAAKKLGIAQSHEIWTDIAALCGNIRRQGMQMFNAKALTRIEVLKLCDSRQTVMARADTAKKGSIH
jgi:hypothetical protein